MIKMKDLFGFINDFIKIIYKVDLKLILKRSTKDRALFRINSRAGVVANDCNIENIYIS